MRTIVWFRGKDLRVADHAPLRDAAAAGEVVPLFVLDPSFFAPDRARRHPHRIQFLLDALTELQATLASLGAHLVVVEGKSVDVVPAVAQVWGADRVVAHGWVDPVGRERDARIAAALGERFVLYDGETLVPPGSLRTGSGTPFSVFTHFANRFRALAAVGTPLFAPTSLPPTPRVEAREIRIPTVEALGVVRNPALLDGGESAARRRLQTFLETVGADYGTRRNRLDDDTGTSRLSADLKFGTISVRSVWTAAVEAMGDHAERFTAELLWREFAHHTLWDRPEVLERPFRPAFEQFPWRDDDGDWNAWASGHTGYPVVDAAARQLLAEGFVPNRARMIAASFLTKHLMIDFRRGEAHYLRWLTDGDRANNDLGWQWSAGCGVDAQPYFRVFNPVTQGRTHDPEGTWVRRWVPELARLPDRWVHQPWEAPPNVLRAAQVDLGQTYPKPIVDHSFARQRFLAAAEGLKRGT